MLGEMKKYRKICLGIALTVTAVVVLMVFQPGPSYDANMVDSRLSALQPPYRSVNTCYYADGGSIGINIVDRVGKREQFAIPAHLGETNRYSKVFVGALHDSEAGALEIHDPENTKRMLICILRDMPDRTPYDDYILMCLRMYPVDIARAFYHKMAGHYTTGQ